MKFSEWDVVRFIVAGAVNTSVGYLIYLALLQVMDYLVAYAISYVFGVIISYLVNSLYVFKQRLSWARFLVYPSVYILQFALGTTCVWLLVDVLGFFEWIAPLLASIITIPATFLATRYVLNGRRSDALDDR